MLTTNNEAFDIIRRNASTVSYSAKLSAPQDSSRARSRSQVGRSHSIRRAIEAPVHANEDASDTIININNNEDPEVERQHLPPPQYPISEAARETDTSLVSYRTAPPPFSSLFTSPSFTTDTDQPHGSADSHTPSVPAFDRDHELYDTEETEGPRERSLPAPAYEPPAASSSASTAYQDSLANETKRALPQDTKGESSSKAKDDDSEPPPAYSEGYSPLQSFTYLMAAAGGASSIITQVQQGGPPINTIGGEKSSPKS